MESESEYEEIADETQIPKRIKSNRVSLILSPKENAESKKEINKFKVT